MLEITAGIGRGLLIEEDRLREDAAIGDYKFR
jgi:hypothetical protein